MYAQAQRGAYRQNTFQVKVWAWGLPRQLNKGTPNACAADGWPSSHERPRGSSDGAHDDARARKSPGRWLRCTGEEGFPMAST